MLGRQLLALRGRDQFTAHGLVAFRNRVVDPVIPVSEEAGDEDERPHDDQRHTAAYRCHNAQGAEAQPHAERTDQDLGERDQGSEDVRDAATVLFEVLRVGLVHGVQGLDDQVGTAVTGHELVSRELERTQVVELGVQLRTDVLDHTGHDHLLDYQRVGGAVDLTEVTQAPAGLLLDHTDHFLHDFVVSTFMLLLDDLSYGAVGQGQLTEVAQVGETMAHFVSRDRRDVVTLERAHAAVGEELDGGEDVDRDVGVDTAHFTGLQVHGAFEQLLLGRHATKALNLGGDLVRAHRVGHVSLRWDHEGVRTSHADEVEPEVHVGVLLGDGREGLTALVEGVFRRVTQAGVELHAHFFNEGGVPLEVNGLHGGSESSFVHDRVS
ncbi:hypothetical protein D3C76_154520 [compost metagenome]